MTNVPNTSKNNVINGRYMLKGVIGAGGMGTVWRAIDQIDGVYCALKLIKSMQQKEETNKSYEQDSKRMKIEARIGETLRHPNIIEVKEKGVHLGSLYFTMELIHGISIDDECKRCGGFLEIGKAFNITIKVLEALQYAHSHNIIHRDIKPGNVMLDSKKTENFAFGEPKIGDFGLGKILGDNQSEKITATGSVFGSCLYMSPEQIEAKKDIDHRTDIYSTGIMLHRLITGECPFMGTQMSVLAKKINDRPFFHPDLEREPVQSVIKKAISKDPKDRYQSAEEFKQALMKIQEQSGMETLASDSKTLAKRRRRERRESRQHSVASQSSPKNFYALAIFVILCIVLGLVLFAQMQHYEDKIEKNSVAAKKKLDKAQKKAKKTIAEVKQKLGKELKDAKQQLSKTLANKDREIANLSKNLVDSKALHRKDRDKLRKTRLELIALQNKSVVVPGEFKPIGEKTYSRGGQTNTVKEYKHKKTGMEFVLIPGGSFMMGSRSKKGTFSHEGVNGKAFMVGTDGDCLPIHEVILSPFLISKFEVQVKTWNRIMDNEELNFYLGKGDYKPLCAISWERAMQFCEKAGLTLPSEAQWEYACRAGSASELYWGDISGIYNYAWTAGNNWHSNQLDYKPGMKKHNAFGLYDMLGNVPEWCLDTWHDNYIGAPADGSAWVDKNSTTHVSRGGGIYGIFRSNSFRGKPKKNHFTGIRLVKNLFPKK